MKTHPYKLIAATIMSGVILNLLQPAAHAQTTAFTYQGRLNDGGVPANGTYDLRFRLSADAFANNILNTVFTNGVPVTNGLFTTAIDFGPGWFNGSNYWLEVDVRTNGGTSYTALNPLQSITPTPYAVFANTASNLSGTLPAAQLSGAIASGNLPASPNFSGTITADAFAGNGANVTNVNAVALNGLGAGGFWQLGGNNVSVGQFFGSMNNQPVEIRVNGQRALRLEPDISGHGAPNVIGGSPVNFVQSGVVGATIGGGGLTNAGGIPNSVSGNYGTVGGGYRNTASGANGTVAGGDGNLASGFEGTVSGGGFNIASASQATVGGGFGNQATNYFAAVPGGAYNVAGGQFSFAVGRGAQALHQGAFVWADSQNTASFSSTANDQFLIRAQGGVGIGTSTTIAGGFTLNTNMYLSGHALYLRGVDESAGNQNDQNHGLAYCGPGVTNFAPTVLPDGPVLWGFGGGALGVKAGGAHAVLTWTNGGVLINGGLAYSSDRNLKTGFQTLNSREILERVAGLPVSSWFYQTDTGARHVGPMAQDFHAAFALGGSDDKHINIGDETGVALAAIQGLNEKLEQKQTEITELEARLTKLEQLVRVKFGGAQ